MKLWIVSNLPPPVHGVSVFNEMLLAEFRQVAINYEFVRVGSRDSNSRLGVFGFRKFLRDLLALTSVSLRLALAMPRSRNDHVLYFTPSQSGPGTCRDLLVSLIGKAFAKRVVAHIHGCAWLAFHGRRGLSSKVMAQALRNCDAVICLGERFTSQMISATRLPCVSVNNGVPSVPASSPKHLPSAGPVRFLFLSNFIPSKGLAIAADTVRRLRGAGRTVQLTCAGSWRDRKDRDVFEREFRKEIQEGAIVVVGPVSGTTKQQILQNTHFLLLPIRNPYEGQPLAIIEAMSYGVVPMTTDKGGIPDLLGTMLSTRLAQPGFDTSEILAVAVSTLMECPQDYHHLSNVCLERQRSSLSSRRCASEVIRVLRDDHRSTPSEPRGVQAPELKDLEYARG